jgi:hypothetical protein
MANIAAFDSSALQRKPSSCYPAFFVIPAFLSPRIYSGAGLSYTDPIAFFKAFKLNEFAKVSKAFAFSIHSKAVGFSLFTIDLGK